MFFSLLLKAQHQNSFTCWKMRLSAWGTRLLYMIRGELMACINGRGVSGCWHMLGKKKKKKGRLLEKALTDRLQFWPRVCAAHLQGWLVVEDVVAQFIQLGFGIRGGKLSSILDFLPHLHVNLLRTQHRDTALGWPLDTYSTITILIIIIRITIIIRISIVSANTWPTQYFCAIANTQT